MQDILAGLAKLHDQASRKKEGGGKEGRKEGRREGGKEDRGREERKISFSDRGKG